MQSDAPPPIVQRVLPFLLLVLSCAATPPERAFDEAEAIAHGTDQERVRDLYRAAAQRDPDPLRREHAAIRAAHLEWRVFRNAAAARELLAPFDTTDAHGERARIELELAHDLPAARAAVERAQAAAKTNIDRRKALVPAAYLAFEEKRYRDTIAIAERVIAGVGPRTQSARLLLRAAIHANDDATALRAFRWYYADVPQLVPASVANRQELGRALAKARLYQEASLILDDPEIDAYAAALKRIEQLVDDHYRKAATGDESQRAFVKAVKKELPKDAASRFGAVTTFGETDGVSGMHFGHRVLDERRTVEQYGRRGSIRFILLDNMIANGFMAWILDGRSGAGGWAEKETVYQVRPMYANGPINAWLALTDPEQRAKKDREIADETRRDAERIKTAPVVALPGLSLRMERQYLEALRASAHTRDAFIARYRQEEFDHSIWAHEGRHSIDQTQFGIDDSEELEYRAKLSEIAFAASPRLALTGAILTNVGGDTPHGKANQRVLEGMARVTKVKLNALDSLSDEQLRNAARALDPLAKAQAGS
ncbi:MAG TPA: hypothetical protein VF883_21400 [Thermoanaerobaculia bacterium]|jgi:hypothetical protein